MRLKTCVLIRTEVRSVLDSVVNQVIDPPPPLFAPRPMTIGGSSIFRDPNYDCDGNPIDNRDLRDQFYEDLAEAEGYVESMNFAESKADNYQRLKERVRAGKQLQLQRMVEASKEELSRVNEN